MTPSLSIHFSYPTPFHPNLKPFLESHHILVLDLVLVPNLILLLPSSTAGCPASWSDDNDQLTDPQQEPTTHLETGHLG